MTFTEATDRLTERIALADVANAAGVAENTIRRARLNPDSSTYRSPPRDWPRLLAELAERRGTELRELARELREQPKD